MREVLYNNFKQPRQHAVNGEEVPRVHVPLRVVGGVSEKSWKYSSQDHVAAHDKDTMFVSLHEFRVKKQQPYLVEQLDLAEAKRVGRR